MDPELAGWILEFLLRKPVPDRITKRLLAVLPIPENDFRLKKTLLLRTIHDEVSQGSVPESILGYLEDIEEIDCHDGIATTELMKSAYCAVAVECTAKNLLNSSDDNSEYFNAVKRIWRDRISEMETSDERSQLFTNELIQWRDYIESSLLDFELLLRLGNSNAKTDALNKLRDYLAETWEKMGPPLLESMAAFQNLVQDGELGDVGLDKGAAELFNCIKGRSDCSTDIRGDCVVADRIEMDDGAVCMEEAPQRAATSADGFCLEEEPVTDRKELNEELEKNAETSADGCQELGAKDFSSKRLTEMQGSLLLKHKHAAASQRHHKRVKINDDEEVGHETLHGSYHPLLRSKHNKVCESLKSSSLDLKTLVKDPLPEALQTTELAIKDMHHEPPIEIQSIDLGLPAPQACNSIVIYQPNVANIGQKSSFYESNVGRPSLMEWNSTAQTYQWGDLTGDLPEKTSEYACRYRLPSSKKNDISPLEKYEPLKFTNRRRVKKWSSLEEDTLRAGVQRFGRGRWKEILISYLDIFEDRTEVDLKDKWRNMTQHTSVSAEMCLLK